MLRGGKVNGPEATPILTEAERLDPHNVGGEHGLVRRRHVGGTVGLHRGLHPAAATTSAAAIAMRPTRS